MTQFIHSWQAALLRRGEKGGGGGRSLRRLHLLLEAPILPWLSRHPLKSTEGVAQDQNVVTNHGVVGVVFVLPDRPSGVPAGLRFLPSQERYSW